MTHHVIAFEIQKILTFECWVSSQIRKIDAFQSQTNKSNFLYWAFGVPQIIVEVPGYGIFCEFTIFELDDDFYILYHLISCHTQHSFLTMPHTECLV